MNFIAHNMYVSWIIHFCIFFALQKWSGIKWQWALVLIFGIEVWEMLDWSYFNMLAWWTKLDTWVDISFGLVGLVMAKQVRLKSTNKK